jgi:RND family efflux transporter MFP subunit
VAVLGGAWFAMHRTPAVADKGAQAPVVTVVVPGRTSVSGTINATGVLAAKHDMPVASVGEGGQVAQVMVNAGDWVKKGQLLAIIDRSVQAEQDANQQAQVRVSEADARLAQSNLDRALKLVDRGFISKANIDQLTATRDAANARVRVSQASLGETRARIRRLSIVAPSDGLVLDRMVEPGQVVGGGTGTLFRIAEHGEMEMRARLSENDLAHLAVGQRCRWCRQARPRSSPAMSGRSRR